MRILIADDHELVRSGVRSLLLSRRGFIVCGEAVDGQDAIDKALDLHPDAVIMDISMPRLNGLAATREIHRALPDTRVIILSQHDTGEMMRHAHLAGADGYVVKSAISADLVSALRKILPAEQLDEVSVVPAENGHRLAAGELLRPPHSAPAPSSLPGAELFRDILDSLPAALYATDATGHITYANPSAVEFAGRKPDLGSDRWCVSWKLFRRDGSPLPHDECPMAVALKEGVILNGYEAIMERPDGVRRWFTPYPRLLRDSSGAIVGGINLLMDITEHKRDDQAKSLLAAIVDSSDDAIVSKNLDGIITSWNHGAERIFGYSPEEVLGRHITIIVPPDRLQEEMSILERLRRGERIEHFETVRMRKDHQSINASLTISPLKDADGRIVGASKVARDITERKRAEEAMLRSEARLLALTEKLDAEVVDRTRELRVRNAELEKKSNQLRDLSWRLLRVQDEQRRQIARELHDSAGQILTVIGMSLGSLLQDAKQTAPAIAGAAGEIQQLVQQLNQEIRTTSYLLHPPLLDEIGLPAAIRWYTEGLAARSGLEIEVDIPDGVERLPREVELAIYRLVQECLTNVHRHSESKSASIRIQIDAEAIYVSVSDQGKGIPPERLAEIQSQGCGVGFQGMRERLREFQGEVSIESTPAGTTVLAIIPILKYASPDPDEENEDLGELQDLRTETSPAASPSAPNSLPGAQTLQAAD